jgi:hypothetical protein
MRGHWRIKLGARIVPHWLRIRAVLVISRSDYLVTLEPMTAFGSHDALSQHASRPRRPEPAGMASPTRQVPASARVAAGT